MSPTLLAIGASIAAFWNQARNLFQKAISIVIRSERIPNSTATLFLEEVYPNCKKIGIGNFMYSTGQDFNSKGAPIDFLFCNKTSYLVFYKGFHPAIFSSKSYDTLTVTYIAGTFPILNILKKIGERKFSDSKPKERFYVARVSGAGPQNNSLKSSSASVDRPPAASTETDEDSFFGYFQSKDWVIGLGVDLNIFEFDRQIPKKNFYWHEAGRKIKNDVKYWLDSQSWYAERGIPWRRGCLLHGEPGSGKSKLITEICSDLNIPLRVFDISGMTNSEFVEFFTESPRGSVVLIEDIDAVFDGRENLVQKTRINNELMTFDCLINTLSGAKQTNGVYVFITTNNIEKLDSALIRSGRIDGKFEIPKLDDEGKRFIASNILKGFEYLIEETISNNKESTAADFENICIELAKNEYWKTKIAD